MINCWSTVLEDILPFFNAGRTTAYTAKSKNPDYLHEKADKPPLMYLPLDKSKSLLEQPNRTTIQGKRDAVLLSLLYDTGARVQELVDLKVRDVTLNETVTIILTRKGLAFSFTCGYRIIGISFMQKSMFLSDLKLQFLPL